MKISLKYALLLAVLSFAGGIGLYRHYSQQEATQVVETLAPSVVVELTYPHLIPPKSTVSSVLKDLGVNAQTIHEIVLAAKPVINLGKLRAGTKFRLSHLTDPSSEVIGIEFQMSPVERIEIKKLNGKWAVQRWEDKVETRVVNFQGTVKTNLWASAGVARMDANLIVQLAEIFAWEVDFAREVRMGDRWGLSVEQQFVRGKPIGWGSILAAEYVNNEQRHTAVLFQVTPEQSGYFSEDGSNLRRMFLKSPIRYGRITSRFQSKRFHPVLKISRPHLGVDYGAPTGTPIRAVGDGLVTLSSWSKGGGRTVRIRHNSQYETVYLHMSRFEKGAMKGARVKQGQVIGYVGSSGLATGPHLHFEFIHSGKVVDPLKQSFPAAEPLPPERLAEFKAYAATALQSLVNATRIAASERESLPAR